MKKDDQFGSWAVIMLVINFSAPHVYSTLRVADVWPISGRYGHCLWPMLSVADIAVADMIVAGMVCGRYGLPTTTTTALPCTTDKHRTAHLRIGRMTQSNSCSVKQLISFLQSYGPQQSVSETR